VAHVIATARAGADQGAMAMPSRGRALDEGFTLIEILVASFVLVVGLLGVLGLLNGALRTTSVNIERVGATNIARELVERTRGLDYDDMSGGLVKTRLQAQGLGSGTPWTIERRGVTYTISSSSCTYDDPADKVAATPPANVCTPQPTGATGDSNGEDFRRTTFDVAWTERGGTPRTISQSTLVVNPSGGLGPRIVSFTPITQTITTNVSSVSVVWTTTPATALRWFVDDGASSGSSTGSTSFTTNWSIGSSGSGSEILDGTYEISAQPFDDRDIAGEAKRAQVLINRRQAYAPPALGGGHDTRAGDWVDLQWSPNSERDIQGYRVFWAGANAIVGDSDDAQVCPGPGVSGPLSSTATSCTDLTPATGPTKYYVVAVDRDASNNYRNGDRRAVTISAAGSRPGAPAGPLTVATADNAPQLSWSAPVSGTVNFYRIYRDGTAVGYADRYGRTTGTGRTFTDDSAASLPHRYWVTTVDNAFNESDPLGPVTWTP
jgi:prepilin-type N-terminal cleavage/methylation domain-containing protein